MAIFTVTSNGDPESEGLSFEAAVAAANATSEADTIRFSDTVAVIELGDVVAISGQLQIEGDHNNDGVSDVLLRAARYHRHLTIAEGADVTITNVDFAGGFDRPMSYETGPRPPADSGAWGSAGTLAPTTGFDGAHGNDDATDGADGSSGVDGLDAAGSILNRGMLTLERVGFARNQAFGEVGESGGFGGGGGRSDGGDGKSDTWTEFRTGAHYAHQREMRDNLIPGGHGGDGGDAGHGGDGAPGGDGGSAAGAILNDGILTLVDTVFGGRLSSGTLANGNEATGGNAGNGGGGGAGGSSSGGDGGNSGMGTEGSRVVTWNIPERYWDEPWAAHQFVATSDRGTDTEKREFFVTVRQDITNEAGMGGDGGRAGDGGNGAAGGTGGSAATIINSGQMTGSAALPTGSGETGPTNKAESGDGGDGGRAGPGGESRGGEGGIELGPAERLDHHGLLLQVTGDSFWEASHDAPFVNDIRDELRSWDMEPPGSSSFPITGRAAWGTAGRNGAEGSLGSPGMAGEAARGVLNEGTGSATFTMAETLVYLHDMGQDPETGTLAFNIIRMGNPLTAFSIDWTVTGEGASPVSAADFAEGTALSGTVSFGVAEITRDNADGPYARRFQHETDAPNNIRRIELDIAGDTLDELPEGYRITLTGDAGGVVLGTDAATGTLIDTMIEASGPITGTPGPDTLDGTAGADEILGLGGDDLLRGMGGDDTLEGGDGADTLNGGDGDDLIRGGETGADLRDVIYAGSGDDSVDGGHGNDQIYGMDGNDTLAGGFGADTIEGQDGDDVITGSAFGDIVFGNAGNDFVNGGFGHDLINGGTGADKFFHAGGDADAMLGHGSDWVQDYSAAEGDVLVFGGSATASQFQVNFTHTTNKTTGERSGNDDVQEAFVIYRPTGQILWALVDGAGQDSINLQIGAEVFDLLA